MMVTYFFAPCGNARQLNYKIGQIGEPSESSIPEHQEYHLAAYNMADQAWNTTRQE